MYRISFYGKKYNIKPVANEIAAISNGLSEIELSYTDIADAVGECGCTFSPAVFSGKRNKDNFKEQQLIALDFDNGAKFSDIKAQADKYGLPILFAYKTFSYTIEKEKFRIVFALDKVMCDDFTANTVIGIFMKIFSECDIACKDVSRMFFGGKGLLYLTEKEYKINPEMLFTSFNAFMADLYGERHYKERVRDYCYKHSIQTDSGGISWETQELEHGGKCTFTIIYNNRCANSPDISDLPVIASPQKRRSVTRNFDWDSLYECCQLFRNFYDGTEYYYYPELFHVATNLCNIEKGKKVFLEILNSQQNSQHKAYHERNWNVILNNIIKSDYNPQSCETCHYCNNCNHLKNMILTAKPSKSDIRIIEKKDYCTIEEAEESLKSNFYKAMRAIDNSIHIINAQTGIGKTHLYLNYMKNTDKPLLIAVPTHKLKNEVYHKALNMGIENIVCTPEMPQFTDDLMDEINHLYNIGAGVLVLNHLKELFLKMNKNNPDYTKLGKYLIECAAALSSEGHIITTHERFLYIPKDDDIFLTHTVIIDEDIMRAVFSTSNVTKSDIHNAIKSNMLGNKSLNRLEDILSSSGYKYYNDKAGTTIDTVLTNCLYNIDTNVLDLLHSKVMYIGEESVTFINENRLPKIKLIVMSATANSDVYRLMMRNRNIIEYRCKKARYMGKIIQYTNHTYSRCCMRNNEGIIEYLKKEIGNDVVITFKEFEGCFDSEYHFGNTEGVNCLEGQNISVIGIPNVNDIVYKLYALLAHESIKEQMCSMRIQYNGYDFCMHTFKSHVLRTIQIWLIESLLEQAVGRARLLRYNCTVKVFAGFPVEQAEFVK